MPIRRNPTPPPIRKTDSGRRVGRYRFATVRIVVAALLVISSVGFSPIARVDAAAQDQPNPAEPAAQEQPKPAGDERPTEPGGVTGGAPAGVGAQGAEALPAELVEARTHLAKGRYEEAREAFALQLANPVVTGTLRLKMIAVIGHVRSHLAEGLYAEATKLLETARTEMPNEPDILAELASLQYTLGQYAESRATVDAALALSPEHPLSRFVAARLDAATGKLDSAIEGYRWFVRMYNQSQPTDPQVMLVVAQGAAEYARLASVTQVFDFVLNTLNPDILARDPLAWEAKLFSGTLLLEKYNRGQAIPELKKGLEINPRAVEILSALARSSLDEHSLTEADEQASKVLEINPRHVPALLIKADVQAADGNLASVLEWVDKAAAVNSRDEEMLARRAAVFLQQDGVPSAEELQALLLNLESISELKLEKPSRFSALVTELAAVNPRPGTFFTVLGERLEESKRFELAEKFLNQAIVCSPQMAQPKTALGLLYARIGKNEQATGVLDAAFAADPYHVRVSNMRKVLKLLSSYDKIETEHFVIRFDSQSDKLLAASIAEYLESEYPALVKQFGFEPPFRTQFEIFNKAKGLSGHQWFSARMVGLPWIQTVGASTGLMVAMASPGSGDTPFNWARVVKHEFIHIITLQQTDFVIPHWYTEALATMNEGYPFSETWNNLLRQRLPRNELMTLANINLGFIRPKSGDDWQMAYCQSVLYARYMVERFGPDSTARLLAAYQRRLPTEQAITETFNIPVAEFETGYLEFVKKYVESVARGPVTKPMSLAELEKQSKANPNRTDFAAQYAAALVDAKRFRQAREIAEPLLKNAPNEPLANYTMSLLYLRSADVGQATLALEAGLDRTNPNGKIVEELGKLYVRRRKGNLARELYLLALKFEPGRLPWLKGLAAAQVVESDVEGLKKTLQQIAASDADDFNVRKKLTELCYKTKDYAAARDAAQLALHIVVGDVEVRRILGASCRELGDLTAAEKHLQIAFELKPDDPDTEVELARVEFASGKAVAATDRLQKVLDKHPDSEAARALLGELQAGNAPGGK